MCGSARTSGFSRNRSSCKRVGHDEQSGLVDGAGAEGDVARRLRHVHPDPRLEPLAVTVDEADRAPSGAADLGRQEREIVEALLGLSCREIL